jgi:pimeloyl-ACP methyl ester carboxylesterase
MRHITLPTTAGPVAARLWDGAGRRAPWLHFGHATGMHAGLYAGRLGELAASFNILACDVRGHGRTARLGNCTEFASWDALAGDLLEVIGQIAPDAPWLLAGHSLGAVVAALAAARAPGRVARLVLIEPAIMPFAAARAGGPARNLMAEQAAARRPAFSDTAAARAAWTGRGVLGQWAPGDLDAYIADALLPGTPARLACTPAFEAMTYNPCRG